MLSGAAGRVPLRVPRLVEQGAQFIVMEEVPDIGRRDWSEPELQVLLIDLAALHDAFSDTPETSRGPLATSLPSYVARVARYGETAGIELPERLGRTLEQPGELLEQLAQAPVTLVHTDPYPRNIRQPESGARVWIDWEDAVFGPAALDLAAWFLEGPWSLGRPFDRKRALDTYCGARATGVPRLELERTLDAALILVTLTQNLRELATQPGRLEVLNAERIAALDRLGIP